MLVTGKESCTQLCPELSPWFPEATGFTTCLIHCTVLQEFDKVPMFMKTAPDEIDPMKHPELAAIQSIIHDDDRPLEGMTAITVLSTQC